MTTPARWVLISTDVRLPRAQTFSLAALCQVGDTISVLVGAAMVPEHAAEVTKEKQRTFETLGREYMDQRDALMSRLFSDPGAGADWLARAMAVISAFEIQMNDRVVSSGVLSGASMHSIVHAARKVDFRQACIETLHRASLSPNTRVAVLSANWSEEFIRASLENPAHGVGLDVGRVELVANSLEFEAARTTGGMRLRRCQTPNDKERLLKGLLGGADLSVYVGDSVGDVPALLGAGVGIVMGRNALLGRVLERGGVDVCDLGRLLEEAGGGDAVAASASAGRAGSRARRVLYQTDTWKDVRQILGV